MASGAGSSPSILDVFVNVVEPGVARETQITKLDYISLICLIATFYFILAVFLFFIHIVAIVYPCYILLYDSCWGGGGGGGPMAKWRI